MSFPFAQEIKEYRLSSPSIDVVKSALNRIPSERHQEIIRQYKTLIRLHNGNPNTANQAIQEEAKKHPANNAKRSDSLFPPIIPKEVHSRDKLFIANCFDAIPSNEHKELIEQYMAVYSDSTRDANLIMLNARDHYEKLAALEVKYINFSPSRKHAKICSDLIKEGGIDAGVQYCENMGVGAPLINPDASEHEKNSPESAIKRMLCAVWWKRRLKKMHRHNEEQYRRDVGIVYRDGELYCSDIGVAGYVKQQTKGKEYVDNQVLISEDNEEVELSTVVKAGVGNAYNRFSEFMTQIKGMEAIADRDPIDYALVDALPSRITFGKGGYRTDVNFLNDIAQQGDKIVKVAFALTVPSRFHPYRKTNNGYIKNPKYEKLTPKDAQAWLQETWNLTTREWERNSKKASSIDAYGFKVLEVHHAGTVHNHLAIYVAAKDVQRLITIFYNKALRGEEGKEKGAELHRLNWKIMANDGGMVNYMTKYIAKGITGADFEDLQAGKPSEQTVIRILAHRSIWGLRQFAFYRSPSVQVWRELRRLRDKPQADPLIEKARLAAIDSDWAAYVDVQGGAFLKMRDRPIKTLKELKCDEKGKECLNQYGEYIERVTGIECGDVAVVTRLKEWKLVNIQVIKQLIADKCQQLINGELPDTVSHGIDVVIDKARSTGKVHKLAQFAGISAFAPLDLYGITPRDSQTVF